MSPIHIVELELSIEQRLINLELEVKNLRGDTQEVFDWLRNGRFIISSVERAGNGIYWLAKMIVAFMAIYGVVTALRDGKVFALRIPFL